MPLGYGGGANHSNPPGYWGPHDSLHTFCEPSYVLTEYAAEPINALGSVTYIVFGLINLSRLYSMGQPLCWRATAGWWALTFVGFGSVFFHSTMRYHAELLDEIPMLILVGCGSIQVSDVHPWGKRKWRGVSLFDAIVIGGISAFTAIYLITRIFGLFITGFTVGTIFLLGICDC